MSFYELHVEQRGYFYFSHVKKETEAPPHFHGAASSYAKGGVGEGSCAQLIKLARKGASH